MPRAPLPIALTVLALASCARAPAGPEAPIALEQVVPAPALAGSATRQTALEFLEAYAGSPRDGGAALADLVTGPELERWAFWLAVQNAQFPGLVEGSRDVRSLAFVGTAPTERALGAQVNLGASVTFGYAPVDGDPFVRTRILDGPVTLVSTRAGDWRVLDLTRDGVPMSDGIELFQDEVRSDGGMSVRLDSLFMFVPNWQFNVVVENRTGSEVRLDPNATGLFVRRADGGFERLRGALSPALAVLPTGSGVQSMLNYPLQDSAEGRVLVLAFRQDGRAFRFEFPLGDLVTAVPPPPPTGDPMGLT
jgi:hypothetical protein